MAEERTYTIPLRREFIKVQRYKRAKKATSAVREFLQKHFHTETVKLGAHLNLSLWQNGMKNPPRAVRVTAIKDDKGIVRAELVGAPSEPKPTDKTKKQEQKAEKKDEKLETPKTKETDQTAAAKTADTPAKAEAAATSQAKSPVKSKATKKHTSSEQPKSNTKA